MQSIQLKCPHCGSTLNLGVAIAAGTPVQCLICAQTFQAQPIASAPAKARPEIPTAPKVGVLVAKPHAAASAQSTKPALSDRQATMDSSLGSKGILWVATLILVALLFGAGFAIWKVTDGNRAGSSGVNPQQIAVNPAPVTPKNDEKKDPIDKPKTVTPAKATDPATPPAKGSGDDNLDDLEARKIKEAEKKKLTRKLPTTAGKELEFDPITTIAKPPPVFKAPGLDAERINNAIAKGVDHLKKSQASDGGWTSAEYKVGYASFGGLTLLECKVPAAEPSVQRAASFVRANVANLTATYELALAVLFLDRLGDPNDRRTIQALSLRLLAGQDVCGGWTYQCPSMSPQEMVQLYQFVQSHKRAGVVAPTGMKEGPPADPKLDPADGPFRKFAELLAAKGLDGNDPKDGPPAKVKPQRPESLPQTLRGLMIVKNQDKSKGQIPLRVGAGDNSNTQFALLALWAARRHDVATDQAILIAYQRFITSQNPDHGWGYTPGTATNANNGNMTCVGLLGLAMGHGVAPDVVKGDPNNPKEAIVKPALQDAKIQNALKALARHLGDPASDPKLASLPADDFYFLWSVERVAMLYDLNDINGKDWYGAGAQLLVYRQTERGDWGGIHQHGGSSHIPACFALLFLKRSNLVQDLTNNLRLHTAIRVPE